MTREEAREQGMTIRPYEWFLTNQLITTPQGEKIPVMDWLLQRQQELTSSVLGGKAAIVHDYGRLTLFVDHVTALKLTREDAHN